MEKEVKRSLKRNEIERAQKEYWEDRVKTHARNRKRMIWYGQEYKFDTMSKVSRHILSMFQNCTALEIGCGYGRMCNVFKKEKYLGIDFSEEMIGLAKAKHPEYNFLVTDAKEYVPDRRYDIVFGIMIGDFPLERFYEYVKVALIHVQPSLTTIKFKHIN